MINEASIDPSVLICVRPLRAEESAQGVESELHSRKMLTMGCFGAGCA